MSVTEAAARDLELVFALAGPVGSDLQEISRTLRDALEKGEYLEVEEIGISKLIADIARNRSLSRADGTSITLVETPEEDRIASYMDAGNAIRALCSDDAALASAAMADIRGRRSAAGGKPSRRAYIIRSLKRPEEVNLLRRVYGTGFFLIGVNVSMPDRVKALAAKIAGSHGETTASAEFEQRSAEAQSLATRDEEESREKHGQRLRDVFNCAICLSAPRPPPRSSTRSIVSCD